MAPWHQSKRLWHSQVICMPFKHCSLGPPREAQGGTINHSVTFLFEIETLFLLWIQVLYCGCEVTREEWAVASQQYSVWGEKGLYLWRFSAEEAAELCGQGLKEALSPRAAPVQLWSWSEVPAAKPMCHHRWGKGRNFMTARGVCSLEAIFKDTPTRWKERTEWKRVTKMIPDLFSPMLSFVSFSTSGGRW